MTLQVAFPVERIPSQVRHLAVRLAEAGYRCWVVGGSVRDLLLEAEVGAASVSDWDLATDATPDRVMALFRRVIPTGVKHGTVTVLVGRNRYEVTTLRGEVGYTDGRRPDQVHFVNDIAADLQRRDFTVNAIAYDLANQSLVDPFGGAHDLAARLIRAVGDPAARFAEDGLRVLRAARFVATLEFELHPDTAAAIRPSLGSYRKVSPERLRDEWLKALRARRPSRAFDVMREHGLLELTAPALMRLVGCEQNRHHTHDVWTHTMECVDLCPPDPLLRMAALLHDIGKPESRTLSPETGDYTFYRHEHLGAELADRLLQDLRFSNDERQRVTRLIRHHLVPYDSTWTDSAVRRWLRRVEPDLVGDLLTLCRADARAKGTDVSRYLEQLSELEQRIEQSLEQGATLSVRDLAVDGRDLMASLNLEPGPLVGRLLRALLEEVTEDPEANEREHLIGRARALARESLAGTSPQDPS